MVVGCRKAVPGRLLAEQVKQVTSTAGSVNWLECGDPVHEIYKLGPTPSVFSFDARGKLSRYFHINQSFHFSFRLFFFVFFFLFSV